MTPGPDDEDHNPFGPAPQTPASEPKDPFAPVPASPDPRDPFAPTTHDDERWDEPDQVPGTRNA